MILFDASNGSTSSRSSPPAAGDSVSVEPPDGWTKGDQNSIVTHRFRKTDADQSAQITISRMPAAVNEWPMNVRRWAGEVGINDYTDEQITTNTKDVDIDSQAAQMIELAADGSAPSRPALVAVMLVKDDDAWFFKLSGNSQIVEAESATFQQFLEAARFEN